MADPTDYVAILRNLRAHLQDICAAAPQAQFFIAVASGTPLNCAAIPKDLGESLFFGHKRGAFTGSMSDQIGKFDQADGETLFLDELAELPLPIHAFLS